MYLSHLLINVGDDPDRPRPGRLWLRNIYHVHQRLCMAFPSADRKSDDKGFLKPFKPDDFGSGQVHVERSADTGFLFRIDALPGGRAVVLVQSAVKPNWEYAFHNAGYLLAAPPEMKSLDPSFARGQRLRFRLVANPTMKTDTMKKGERQSCTKEELKRKKGRHGKRVPVPPERLHEWLARRAETAGLSIEKDSTTVQLGYIHVKKTQNSDGQRLCSARYDGILEVTDPASFKRALICGIGPGKAFGFGLLSVAPVRPSLEER